MRRFWLEERQMFLKQFMSTSYQSNFVRRHIKEFVVQIDGFLSLKGVLTKNFNTVGATVGEHVGRGVQGVRRG